MDQQSPPATSASAPATPPQIVIQQQASSAFGRFGKWLLALLVIVVLFAISLYGKYQSYFSPADRPQERFHSLSRTATKKIAIIDISGPILSGEGSFAKAQIDRVREDEDVVGVVVRVNSPGGTVTGSDYLLHHLRQMRIEDNEGETRAKPLPLVVSMGSLCASGGYYIAMAVGDQPDSIFAEPTTWTGSIGVIIPHYDLSTAMSSLFIKDDSIVSGPYKAMLSPTRPMSAEERKIAQTLVDESFAGFKKVVVSGRPKFKDDAAALDASATGQIFTAEQAVERGLVDQIGFVEAAIERVAKLAGVGLDEVRCVQYQRPPTLVGALLGTQSETPAPTVDVATLLDLATPRAYYLWSWLPAEIANSKN